MIWTYTDTTDNGSDFPGDDLRHCPFCSSRVDILGEHKFVNEDIFSGMDENWVSEANIRVCVCNTCGWWSVSRKVFTVGPSNKRPASALFSWPDLLQLDVSDVSIPINELRTYLLGKYNTRFMLNPRRFEEIVASIFSDFGYRVRLTSYSGDDGIDIVALDGQNNDLVGIQVKRYKGKIQAEQIRSFAGALVLNKLTKGIYVTTSAFTRGAVDTSARFSGLGYPIALEDPNVFYDRLKLKTRNQYTDLYEPTSPFYKYIESNWGASYRGMMPL